MAGVLRLALIAVLALPALFAGAATGADGPSGPLVEVVVALEQAPLATSTPARTLAIRSGAVRKLSLRAPASVSRLRTLASAQRSVQERLEAAVPDAAVRWRYRIVANGLAVVLPSSEVGRLAGVPGVRTVYPSVTYRPSLDRAPPQIG